MRWLDKLKNWVENSFVGEEFRLACYLLVVSILLGWNGLDNRFLNQELTECKTNLSMSENLRVQRPQLHPVPTDKKEWVENCMNYWDKSDKLWCEDFFNKLFSPYFQSDDEMPGFYEDPNEVKEL